MSGSVFRLHVGGQADQVRKLFDEITAFVMPKLDAVDGGHIRTEVGEDFHVFSGSPSESLDKAVTAS